MVSEGTRRAEEFIAAGRERQARDEAEKKLKKLRFKGKTIEITKEGKIKPPKKEKLTKKQIATIRSKLQTLKKIRKKNGKKISVKGLTKREREKILKEIVKKTKQQKSREKFLKDIRRLRELQTFRPQPSRPLRPSTVGFVPTRRDFEDPLLQPMLKAQDDVLLASLPTIDAGLQESIDVEASAQVTLNQGDREVQLIDDLLSGRL